jgi:TPR repeat protein
MAKAVAYYRKSADQGNRNGQKAYEGVLEQGLGIRKEPSVPGIQAGLIESAIHYKELADRGDAAAQYVFGLFFAIKCGFPKELVSTARFLRLAADGPGPVDERYFLCPGTGAEADLLTAREYLRSSADLGNAYAQFAYGNFLEYGFGIPADLAKAATYYKRSADQGNSYGQYAYGTCLEGGLAIPQDAQQAVACYKLSADQGNAHGQFRYGLCHELGVGVAEDVATAAVYFKLAADRGHAEAQFNYANYLQYGLGVPKDVVLAAEYYK